MSDLMLIVTGILLLVCGILIGTGLTYYRLHRQFLDAKTEGIRLTAELEHEKILNQQQMEKTAQLTQSFQQISNEVLKQNSEAFLRLARENLGQFQTQATGELEKKEIAFSNLIKPIRETLEKTQQQIHLMEKDRKEAYGALNKHLETMAATQTSLQNETRNLVKAFHRPEVRGQWGELTLRRLAELAGMVEHCDFFEQTTTQSAEGNLLRPDMLVKMPGGREIIVDSKTPLDAYLDAVEADSDVSKQQALERHLRHVKQRIKELSNKAYWEQFKQTPDFVVLFIPGDQFLNAALDLDRNLIEEALRQKVILSTPTSFVALLRAVAYGWRQETLAENAELIRQLGEEMYTRIATFSEHLGKVGKSLNQSVEHYNKSVATLSSRVLPSAKKFREMGVHTKKDLADLEPVEKTTRPIEIETNV